MDAKSLVGPVTRGDGSWTGPFASSRQGGWLASQPGWGRFYEMTSRGWVYHVTTNTISGNTLNTDNGATSTTPPEQLVAGGTTFISILNPIGSGVNFEILQGLVCNVSNPGNAVTGFWGWFGANAGTAITASEAGVRKGACLIGQGVTKAKAWSLTALTGGPTQTVLRPFANAIFIGAGMLSDSQSLTGLDLVDGAIVVPPGGLLSIGAPFMPAAGHVAIGSILYAEVPISS